MGTDAIATFSDYTIGLELLVRANLSSMEVIRAATSVAADAIGLGSTTGTPEPGKEADVIVVNGDPTSGIRAGLGHRLTRDGRAKDRAWRTDELRPL